MTTTDKLAEALRDAATSLETIALSAGKAFDTEGQENYLRYFDQVRGYANSRASVAREALAEFDSQRQQADAGPRQLDPTKIQLCRQGQHSADARSIGQPCNCPEDTCRLWNGGLQPAAAPAPVEQAEPVGEVKTITGSIFNGVAAASNQVVWKDGMQPPPGTKLYAAPVAQPAAGGVPAGFRAVAKVQSWTNGSYWRNYKLAWLEGSDDLEAGAVLYAAAAPQAGGEKS